MNFLRKGSADGTGQPPAAPQEPEGECSSVSTAAAVEAASTTAAEAARSTVDKAIAGCGRLHGFVRMAGIHCHFDNEEHSALMRKYGVTDCKLPSMRLLSEGTEEELGFMAHMDQ